MKQTKPNSFPKPDENGHLPQGTKPLPMRLGRRADRATSRRSRGKRGAWLSREPHRLSGASGKGKK